MLSNTHPIVASSLHRIVTCIFLTLFAGKAVADIKYGEWQITVQVQATGLPVEVPPETYTKCISQRNLTPGTNHDKKSCGNLDIQKKGDTVTWSVNCAKGGDTMKGSGNITYTGDAMAGTGLFEAGGKTMPTMKMNLNYTGKRLGPCTN